MTQLPACPVCNSEYTYEDGDNYVCPECAHEWGKTATADADEAAKVIRDANGNVTRWDTHGFSCAICVDVARESMQLYNSGADVASIRAAIERKWTPQHHTRTPTPPVPPKKR